MRKGRQNEKGTVSKDGRKDRFVGNAWREIPVATWYHKLRALLHREHVPSSRSCPFGDDEYLDQRRHSLDVRDLVYLELLYMGLGIKIRSYETRGRIFAHQCWKPPATFTKIYSQQRGPESARMALETHVCIWTDDNRCLGT